MTATLKYTTLRYFSQVTADSRNTVSSADQRSRPRRAASLTLPPRGPGHPCHPLRPAGFLPHGSRFPLPRVGQHDCCRLEVVATTASASGYWEGDFSPHLAPPRGLRGNWALQETEGGWVRLRTQWASVALRAGFRLPPAWPLETDPKRKRCERQLRPASLAGALRWQLVSSPRLECWTRQPLCTPFPGLWRVPSRSAEFLCRVGGVGGVWVVHQGPWGLRCGFSADFGSRSPRRPRRHLDACPAARAPSEAPLRNAFPGQISTLPASGAFRLSREIWTKAGRTIDKQLCGEGQLLD